MAAPIDSLADDIEAAYPPSHPKDGTVAGRFHDANSPNSDHRPKPISGTGIVRAVDFGEHDEEVFGILDAIRASRDSRIKYGIHHGQMFSSYASAGTPPYTWRPYTRGGHIDHGHVSTLTSADAQAGAWDIGTDTGDDMMPSLPLKYGDGTSAGRPEWDQEVKSIQYGLSYLGYDIGSAGANGEYLDDLVAAVIAFRTNHSSDWDGNGRTWTGFSDQLFIRELGAKAALEADIELEVTKVEVVSGVKIK